MTSNGFHLCDRNTEAFLNVTGMYGVSICFLHCAQFIRFLLKYSFPCRFCAISVCFQRPPLVSFSFAPLLRIESFLKPQTLATTSPTSLSRLRCVSTLTFDKWRFDMFVLESPSALVNPALPIGNPRPGPVGPYRGPVGFHFRSNVLGLLLVGDRCSHPKFGLCKSMFVTLT